MSRPGARGGQPPGGAGFVARGLLGLAALLLGVGLVALVLLAARPLGAVDRAVAAGLNGVVAPRPWLVTTLQVLTLPGATTTAIVVLSTLALALLARRQRRLAAFVAVTGLGAAVLGPGAKAIVGRLRPVVEAPVATAPGPSFPSGHTLAVTVWVGVTLLVVLPAVPDRARRAVVATGVAVVVLVALTRVALGVHYLTDVVAGLLLGIGWLVVTTTAFQAWRRRSGLPVAPAGSGLAPEAAPALTPAPASSGGPTRPATTVARLLVAAVLVLGVVTGTGWLVSRVEAGTSVEAADAAAAQWFVAHRTPTLNALSDPTDELGGTGLVIGVALVGSILVLAVLRRWRPVLAVVVAVVGEVLIFAAATAIIDRDRPPVPHLDAELPPTSSFPSGHVAAAICLWGTLAAIVFCSTRRWWRWPVVAAAVSIACLVGLARIYRGAHHPSDLLGSVLLGVLWLLVTLRLFGIRPGHLREPVGSREA